MTRSQVSQSTESRFKQGLGGGGVLRLRMTATSILVWHACIYLWHLCVCWRGRVSSACVHGGRRSLSRVFSLVKPSWSSVDSTMLCPTKTPIARAFYSGGSGSLRVSDLSIFLSVSFALSFSNFSQQRPRTSPSVGSICRWRPHPNQTMTIFILVDLFIKQWTPDSGCSLSRAHTRSGNHNHIKRLGHTPAAKS